MVEKGVKSSLRDNSREVMKLLREEHWGAIKILREKMVAKKEIARRLGISVQTVRKYLKQGGWKSYKREDSMGKILDPYRQRLMRRMSEVDYCAQILFQEIKEQGYKGSYDTVKLFVRPYRQAQRGLEAATIRFETQPGRQSQADWSSVQVWIGLQKVRLQVFVMTLGYSRRIFAVCKENQKLPSLIECHQEAWEHFGGRTEEILYDNPKTIVLKRDYEGRHIQWHPQFLDFARYRGLQVRLCKPYRAQTKGKVESGVKYVKGNFFRRFRHFERLEELNEKLLAWCIGIADQRIHGTTHRKPQEAFGEEKLISIMGKPAYVIEDPIHRQVPNDCLVNFRANRYSVPYQYVGSRVEIIPGREKLTIYHNNSIIASHRLLQEKYNVSMNPEHYKGIFRLRDRHAGDSVLIPCQELSLAHQGARDPAVAVQVRSLSYYEAYAETKR